MRACPAYLCYAPQQLVEPDDSLRGKYKALDGLTNSA